MTWVGVGGQGHRRERPHDVCSIRTPSSSTTTVAAGRPATNEYLPHRSERSTDSRIRPGPSPANAGNKPTGVDTSARSSVQREPWATGSRASRTRHDSASPADAVPRALLLIGVAGSIRMPDGGERNNPDRRPGAAGPAVRARDLRTRRHEAPRAPTPRPGHPVHLHQAAIVPAEQRRRQRRRRPCSYPVEPMRLSRSFVPTLREDPAEAEIASHRLLLRGGFVRQVMSGVYTILPLGLRTMRRIETIVREEMDEAGSIELRM